MAILAPRTDGYTTANAWPGDTYLLIEVADTSLSYDRGRKAPAYARAGIPEYWIVAFDTDVILVMQDPATDGYAVCRELWRGDAASIRALPGVSPAVTDILGPR